jgi:hypothetical protein
MATQFTVSMINAILTTFSCAMVYHFALERLNFFSSTGCIRPDNNQDDNYVRFEDLFQSGYEKGGFGGWFIVGFYGILFSPGKSLFLYNPLTIFGCLAFTGFLLGSKNSYIFGLVDFFSSVDISLLAQLASENGMETGVDVRCVALFNPSLLDSYGKRLQKKSKIL